MGKFNPDYAVHPGGTISETLIQMGLPVMAAAALFEVDHKYLQDVCDCKADVSPGLAHAIARRTSVPATFFLALQRNYNEKKSS